MVNSKQQWYNVCKTMQRIYRYHRDVFPNKLLKLGWPDGAHPFEDGRDITSVNFTHEFASNMEFQCSLDTEGDVIGWPTLAVLLSVFKESYIDPARGRKRDVLKDGDASNQEREIEDAIPYLIHWSDWDGDDEINIRTCGQDRWDRIMEPDEAVDMVNVLSRSPVGEWDMDINFYIGTVHGSRVEILPHQTYASFPSACTGYTEDQWTHEIRVLMNRGYRPMIIQAVDWEVGELEVVYWLEKPVKSRKKHKRDGGNNDEI